ncbi:GNAT family N-acetyltransferase [Paenibacillus qinlingensis]|uniref:Ribosomal protein S18 acetylase RimI-like enzyme n=1 Tax=Paenibacillus qinlingensis TaxID=1837343 RepID=A0ABU1NNV0_9BACL|nr:ribosomal protein S18 acetylase RimI-like enzyme [Paenibacillus qinlingensis]
MGKFVRLANGNDAEILVALNEEFNGVGMTASEVKESLTKNNELVALAILDHIPVGFACAQWFQSFCYRSSQGEITEMYVQDAARQLGLATMLISFLEQELSSRGVTSIKILTGPNNRAAHKTYERSSYVLKDEMIFQKKLNSD